MRTKESIPSGVDATFDRSEADISDDVFADFESSFAEPNTSEQESSQESEQLSPAEVVSEQTDRMAALIEDINTPSKEIEGDLFAIGKNDELSKIVSNEDPESRQATPEAEPNAKEENTGRHSSGENAMDMIARIKAERDAESSKDVVEAETNETPEEEQEIFNNKVSKGLDWVAEKLDGDKGRFSDTVKRIDNLADRIHEEGKKEVALSALRGIGRVAFNELKSDAANAKSISILLGKGADKAVSGLNKLDQQAAKGAGWLLDNLKESAKDAWKKRSARLKEKARQKAEKLRQEEIASVYDEATFMNQHFNDQTEAEKMDKLYSTESEARAMNERYDMQVEAEDMNKAFDERQETIRQAQLRADAAKIRNKQRKEKIKGFANRNLNRMKAGKDKVVAVGRSAKAYAAGVHKAGMESVRASQQAAKINTTQKSVDKVIAPFPTQEATQNDFDLAA